MRSLGLSSPTHPSNRVCYKVGLATCFQHKYVATAVNAQLQAQDLVINQVLSFATLWVQLVKRVSQLQGPLSQTFPVQTCRPPPTETTPTELDLLSSQPRPQLVATFCANKCPWALWKNKHVSP